MFYQPEHFIAQEFVPESVYNKRGHKSLELINPRLLASYDQLRKKFGPCTINNWHIGGNFTESGLRVPGDEYYSQFSQHSYGNAGDGKFSLITPEEIRIYILANPDEFPYITFLELDTDSWLHIDVRNCRRITTWSPNS